MKNLLRIGRHCWFINLIFVCAGLLRFDAKADDSFVLIKNNWSKYHIVVSTEASQSERYAAEELQRYLFRMSGVRLPIWTDDSVADVHEIILGRNRHLSQVKRPIEFNSLGAEGFVLRTEGDTLVIAGGGRRGTLYGVYEFLEQKLGVRWFTPTFEVVPERPTISIEALDVTKIPALEYREVFWSEMLHNADFAARHRLNGDHYNLREYHGGTGVSYFPFVHSMDELVPTNLYAAHPEYFPLIKGKRKLGYVQRCLSNPEVLKLTIVQVRKWIREHPDANIITVSQNDTFNYCECDECKALDDAEGSHSATMIRFVNSVAEDIEHDYPNVRIDTLAYQYTRKPPKTLRPRKNVIIRLCSIECCFAHSLEACPSPENSRFRDDIIAWQPVAPLIYVWDYTPNFGNYLQPFPNFDAIQPNVQFFVKNNVKGLFEQGNYSSGGGGEMEPLRAYLLAKLLWDPNANLKQLTDEFLHAYYGQSAPQITAYLDLLEKQTREKGLHAHIFDKPQAAYLNDELVEGANRLFDEAEKRAESDEVRFRVEVARLPIWYVQLVTKRVQGSEKQELFKKFMDICNKAGIDQIGEGRPLSKWAEKFAAN